MANMTLSEELQWRGFVNQTTYKDIKSLDSDPITFYWGVDPSATSMTIGNLALAMMVRHFMKYGHKPVLLVGGATGLIGDPDGKSEERELKSYDEIEVNKQGILAQYQRLFSNIEHQTVDNYDWFKGLGFLQFLREVGKHVPVRQMINREFVQSRLGESGAGISYAEFSYSLIQAYDFLHLHREYGVTLQVCGSDQWGNSIAGVDLVRRVTGEEVHVWSAPLIVNKSTGVKFGKSESGAIWLDEKLTSVYQFYQFWLNVDDTGVEDYLKIYTLLSRDEIENTMQAFTANKSSRIAQKTLAYEVTKLVHGTERANSIKHVCEVLFDSGDYASLTINDFETLKTELSYVESTAGKSTAQLLLDTGLASSSSEARRFLDQNAVYVNGQQIAANKIIGVSDQITDGYVVLRRGKNTNAILQIKD